MQNRGNILSAAERMEGSRRLVMDSQAPGFLEFLNCKLHVFIICKLHVRFAVLLEAERSQTRHLKPPVVSTGCFRFADRGIDA
jgi:hypothetical protein